MSNNRDRAIARKLIAGYLSHLGLRPLVASSATVNGAKGQQSFDKLQKQQQQQQQQPSLDPMCSDVLRSLVSLTDDYEARYRQQLTELANTWVINSANPCASFTEVLDTIFADGCNWGRVVTIFVFVGMFLRKCRDQQAQTGPEEVTEWTTDYLAEKIAPWIREHGDWTGLVKFHEEGDVVAQMQQESQMFRRLLALAGAAGLVVLTLSTLLANRA